MSRSNRDVLLVVLVLAIAGTGYWIWERFFSHGAQIDAMHRACLVEFNSGKDRVKSQLDQGAAAVPRDEPAAGIVRDISSGLGKVIDRFAGSVGDAACGALRDACTLDFDGQACRMARERYRSSQGASAQPPRAALPGEMRMNARLATKVVVRITMPRSEAQQAPHFAAARRDGSLRASALSLGLRRRPASAALVPQRDAAAGVSRNEPSRPSAGCAEAP